MSRVSSILANCYIEVKRELVTKGQIGGRVNNLSFRVLRTRQSAERSVGLPRSCLGLGTVTYQFDGVDLTRERYD